MTQPVLPRRVGFVGLGLIAGSLARALRASDWQGDVIAWDPDHRALDQGLSLEVIDRAAASVDDLLEQADFIVVGAPPMATATVLAELLPRCAERAEPPTVTDLASIKGYVSDAIRGEYPFFVPGHPIAGSEDSGVAAGRADLFAGREIILTPRPETSDHALARVEAVWRLTGAWISRMSLADHDGALAASSHSPHMVAYALTKALGANSYDPMRHGGGALRDMTRIAGSDPVMWRDVALTNREALLGAIDEFGQAMAELRDLVDAGDAEGLHDYFLQCRHIRREHDRILNPLLSDVTSKDQSS